MELRQLRYFVKIVELGSMGRAAQNLGVATSTLSQQIGRLESELSARLLQRTSTGVVPTASGMAFWKEAVLILRHADNAVLAAQSARLGGHVSIGMAPTTSLALGAPLYRAMRERYPDIRLHMVESLSGNLTRMLETSQLDLAVVFHAPANRDWTLIPVLKEQLFVIGHIERFHLLQNKTLQLSDLLDVPLALPSGSHGLRAVVNAAFFHHDYEPALIVEIDGLSMLMDVVRAGEAVTIQPGAAVARANNDNLVSVPLIHDNLFRPNMVASLVDEQLAPAGLATRVVLLDVIRSLTQTGRWPGAFLV